MRVERGTWTGWELSLESWLQAATEGYQRQQRASAGGGIPNGGIGYGQNAIGHQIGRAGEIAASQLQGVQLWADDTYEAERDRGAQGYRDLSIVRWEIRTRREKNQELTIKEIDPPDTWYMLMLAHDAPVIWCAGVISLARIRRSGLAHSVPGLFGELVDQRHLTPYADAEDWIKARHPS
jgi:hypothetical protein